MPEDAPEITDITDELIAERRSSSSLSHLPDDMPNWMAFLIRWIDTCSLWIGRVVCVLTVPLFTIMIYEVVARYVFTAPTVWVYDMSRFLYGALFMLGAGYALSKGIHIRADFIYRNFPVKMQGMIDASLFICCSTFLECSCSCGPLWILREFPGYASKKEWIPRGCRMSPPSSLRFQLAFSSYWCRVFRNY